MPVNPVPSPPPLADPKIIDEALQRISSFFANIPNIPRNVYRSARRYGAETAADVPVMFGHQYGLPAHWNPTSSLAEKIYANAYKQFAPIEQEYLAATSPGLEVRYEHGSPAGRAEAGGSGEPPWLSVIYPTGERVEAPWGDVTAEQIAKHEMAHPLVRKALEGDTSGLLNELAWRMAAQKSNPYFVDAVFRGHPNAVGMFYGAPLGSRGESSLPTGGVDFRQGLSEYLASVYEAMGREPSKQRVPVQSMKENFSDIPERLRAIMLYQLQGP